LAFREEFFMEREISHWNELSRGEVTAPKPVGVEEAFGECP